MKPDRVIAYEGVLMLANPTGDTIPITLSPGNFARLGEGWKVTKVYAEAPTFSIIDLCHRFGETSFWILADTGQITGNHKDFADWSQDNIVLQTILSHIESIASKLMEHQDAIYGPTIQNFFELSENTRSILSDGLAKRRSNVSIIDLVAANEQESWTVASSQSILTINYNSIMRALHVYLDEQFIDALRNGKLQWPLLTSEGQSDIVHCIFFDYAMGVLRVLEPVTGLTFYITFEGADLKPFGIFVPACMTVFGWSTGPQNVAYGRLATHPDWILNRLRSALLSAPEAVLSWLRIIPTTSGHFLWPDSVAHLGHYLWNELTGIDKIVRNISSDRLPTIWSLTSREQSSFYGALEDLYPELMGRVNRTANSLHELFRYSVKTGTQFVRVSGEFVTISIRERITTALDNDPDIKITEGIVAKIFTLNTPTLLLGLRCGTRTLFDLAEFYVRIINEIHAKVRSIAVIVDGLNSVPGAPQGNTFAVYTSGKASIGPIELERKIADKISHHCKQQNIICINCVGTSLRQNLFWIKRATFFVAPWGGGLAKYRWSLNVPGYALTNAHNLRHPFILSIYHSDRFMEAASPLYYPDPNWIVDTTDNTGAGWQSDATFEVNDAALHDIAARFIDHARGSLAVEIRGPTS